MKSTLLNILILIFSINSFGQGYWLNDFLEDKDINHVDLKIAEKYLDVALSEITSNPDNSKRTISSIAREYYRLSLIEKGDSCKKIIGEKEYAEFESQRAKGLASSQDLEFLRNEVQSTTPLGRTYIAEAFIRTDKVNEAIDFVNKDAKNNWEKERLVEITCRFLNDFTKITEYYTKIGYNFPNPIYLEIRKRIRDNQITPKEAFNILSDLKLQNDRSYELLAYGCSDNNDLTNAMFYSDKISDDAKKLACIQNIASNLNPKMIDCKVLSDRLEKHDDKESKYLIWLLGFKNQAHYEINDEVIKILRENQEFLADNHLVFYLLNNGFVEEALQITDNIRGQNRLTQYEYIIKGFIDAHELNKADSIITRIIKNENCNDCVLKGIETLLAQGNEEKAIYWFENYLTNKDYERTALDLFVFYYMSNRDFSKAEEKIKLIDLDWIRARLYYEIGRYYMGIKWKHVE